MKIYIDFDDVICETAKYFTKIAKELFNIDVPYREVQFFNLQKSFDLSGEQYDELMKAGHIPENLLDYEGIPYPAIDMLVFNNLHYIMKKHRELQK